MYEAVDSVIQMALNKKKVLEESLLRYVTKAALASMFIGFAIIICYRLAEPFFDAKSPVTSFMSSIFFGAALVLIMFGGGELFTGNTMMFSMSTLKKATTWKDALANWAATYAGNIIGAAIFGLFIHYTGLYADTENSQFLMTVVSGKISLTTTQMLFRSILCNWLVCLAFWVPINVKGDGTKIASMMLLVFGFVISGYEHSIANMVLFSLSLAAPHPDTITLAGILHNLGVVTIGNMIGGGVFVGAMYAFLTSKKKDKASVTVIETKTVSNFSAEK
ncbi:transporter [Weizmannia acidilactici]|uniref:Transporter n=1 Tax=Weizmannia acidilactici TaxID=2607726 RepID=A0A5J4JHK1_9BACI|nr:formate/nitrite transporter family protein [Weizmannia acidilactici]GER65869.1 transporter [Weizmannia acidilactici]GER69947.1 transporter [Weizmannia acidilactici]GER73120.1 transporter [Weizmannia acidilactici]